MIDSLDDQFAQLVVTEQHHERQCFNGSPKEGLQLSD